MNDTEKILNEPQGEIVKTLDVAEPLAAELQTPGLVEELEADS